MNSFSLDELKRLTTEKYIQKINLQITRIFCIKDPLVTCVYILPFDIPDDILNYYYKVFELSDISNFKDRLYFIKPVRLFLLIVGKYRQFPIAFFNFGKVALFPEGFEENLEFNQGKAGVFGPGVSFKRRR